MSSGKVYVVGTGLAGLSSAVALAAKGVAVELIEAAGFAGGRCRSYHDATLGQIIDNGNHLLLSGNAAAHEYLNAIGSAANFVEPANAEFAFADIRSGARWTIRPNDGRAPWWVFSKTRRVPGTSAADYLGLLQLMRARGNASVREVYPCRGALWERLMRPLLLAALNTEPEGASAELAAAVLRETLARGGRSYRPRIASPTLAAAFVDPAVAYLSKSAPVRFGRRLTRIQSEGSRVTGLEIAHDRIPVSDGDCVVLAVPPGVAADLVQGLVVPNEFRSILSAHFKFAPPAMPPMIGLIGGTIEWIFSFPDRISVTISNADRLIDREREELAALLWQETAKILGLAVQLPPWQIVKEKRATFAATPEQEKRRPKAETRFANLFLAGDWTATGLPATIEGAVRSGHRAAELALNSVFVKQA
jgi:squalene-associated FAD-dependent desaturase